METLKQHGPIGVALAVISGIAAVVVPVPHAYAQLYLYVFAPVGALIGYGLAAIFVTRTGGWHVGWLVVVAVVALVVGIVSGFTYVHLYGQDPSPPLSMRILHALAYGFTFAMIFFAARWAGLLISKKD